MIHLIKKQAGGYNFPFSKDWLAPKPYFSIFFHHFPKFYTN